MTRHSAAYRRADALLELGRGEEARRMAAAALAEDPEDPALLALLTRAHLQLDEDQAAFDSALRVVAAAPDDEWGHRLVSIALQRLGQHGEALRAATAAVRLDPDSWRTHLQYALAASHVPGYLPSARQAADRTVQLAPHEPDAHFASGSVAHRQHEFERAREAYERTLALDPEHSSARHNLTQLDSPLRYRRAARGYVATLRSDPGMEIAKHNLDGVASVVVMLVLAVQVVGLLVTLLVLQAQPGAIEDARPSVATAVVELGALAVGAGIAWHFLSSLPRGVRAFLRSRLRRWTTVVSIVVGAVFFFAAPIVAAFVPGGVIVGLLALRPIGFWVVILVVTAVVSRARH